MEVPAHDPDRCTALFVTDANLLDDSAASKGQRELLRALTALGTPCEAVCRFLSTGPEGVEPRAWLAERGWSPDGEAEPVAEGQPGRVVRLTVNGVPFTLYAGTSTRAHPVTDEERTAFMQVVTSALGRRPDVVAASGPLAADVLAAARSRTLATVALESDCAPRDPSFFQPADVVLTPTRFAAEYLREALGVPCASLPPVVAGGNPSEPSGPGALVFDASVPGNNMLVFVQIANEVNRRRPDIPLLVLGGEGKVDLPNGGSVQCVVQGPHEDVWSRARVYLAPLASWDYIPFEGLAGLRRGVPVVASDRGANRELFEGSGSLVPLPDRVTAAYSAPLLPAELAPWVDAVIRHFDDGYAARQRGMALLAASRWDADKLAPRYAEFLAGVVAGRKRRYRVYTNGVSGHHDDSQSPIRRLAEGRAWPQERPADAAPGQEQGWLGDGTELMLARVLSPRTKVVVELGAWLGMSSRFIADHAPNATVVSVDHWAGSPEHHNDERYRNLLPRLFETFQSRCWDYRDRLIPLRMNSLDGLRAVAEAGVKPDFVYIDAEHSFQAVTAELNLASQLFPEAELGGDDYDWGGVREAADTFARQRGLVVDRFAGRGWRLLPAWKANEASPIPPARRQWFVLVPHMNGIEAECEQALRWLESAGVRVVRRGGCSAIDVARNEMLSDALHNEAESILFIDSDIGFEPQDALRLLARPEPVISAVYSKKGVRELASVFADGVKEVLFGPEATGPYPLKYAATGFLRVRAGVLRKMIQALHLPLCNTHWGRGVWPFFQPLVVPHGPERFHYLGEDWAFSHRLAQIGVTPLADTSIRLWHWGRYGFSWEDAGSTMNRFRAYRYHLAQT